MGTCIKVMRNGEISTGIKSVQGIGDRLGLSMSEKEESRIPPRFLIYVTG